MDRHPPIHGLGAADRRRSARTGALRRFAINLAAITAAICMGPEAHKNPKKRYVAAIAN